MPCKICKYNPKMLAADGTKIGINVKHSSVLPIEPPTVHTAIDSCHRRNERAFISYSQGSKEAKDKARNRDHILYHCKKALGTLGTANELPLEDERARDNQLLGHVDEPFRPPDCLFPISIVSGLERSWPYSSIFFNKSFCVQNPAFPIFGRLTINFKCIEAESSLDNTEIQKVAAFSPEIRDVLLTAKGTPVVNDAIVFVVFLSI